jgi:hypothetical protein
MLPVRSNCSARQVHSSGCNVFSIQTASKALPIEAPLCRPRNTLLATPFGAASQASLFVHGCRYCNLYGVLLQVDDLVTCTIPVCMQREGRGGQEIIDCFEQCAG